MDSLAALILEPKPLAALRARLHAWHTPYGANDNIEAQLKPGDIDAMRLEAEHAIALLLDALVIDPEHYNTRDTPRRVAAMLIDEALAGRYQPRPALREFPNNAETGELYVVGPLTVRSLCAHHLVPIVGRIWIGCIPDGRLPGLSKFPRLVEWIMARGQMQEEAIAQLADEIEEAIHPAGLGLVIEADHLCISWRGVREAKALMTSTLFRGRLKAEAQLRAEFMALVEHRR